MSQKPILFDLEDDAATPTVADAAPVPDLDGATLQAGSDTAGDASALSPIATRLSRKPSRLGRVFWSVLAALSGAMLSIWAWDFLTGLIGRFPVLGWAMSAGVVLLLALALLFALRELAGLVRLRRVDGLRRSAKNVGDDLKAARQFAQDLSAFYKGRTELAWAQQNLTEHLPDVMDADAVLNLTEGELLAPLDSQALAEVEAAARQVATVTALVPLALADVVVALVASLRMIRRVGEIYGGRSGGLASWRLTRRVFAHLVATGAMAVGDDLLEPVLGGSILSKLSRRFGEGLVNGALSARVGLAAIDLCRPMPFSGARRPKTRTVIQKALKGIIGRNS
ncbi:TIGR01620 family protein [Epibacterium ulvae]|uniref:YcjF family protein n=1 Tax=Epibacterium ulvae TaxID=1156985 RepID=UPI001BFC9600|nr:TIGR01620 family protein [Epibacterium ulvae]MBT8153931.1 TIGR01620 family protein [Epibacterium ulvae]